MLFSRLLQALCETEERLRQSAMGYHRSLGDDDSTVSREGECVLAVLTLHQVAKSLDSMRN